MTTEQKTLSEIRDNFAERSVHRDMLELTEADARVRHYKIGFDHGVAEMKKRVQVLVGALEHYSSDIVVFTLPHMGPVTVSGTKAKEALQEYKKSDG